MARLVLGVAGAVAAPYVGATAAVGWMIGSTIGGLLSSTKRRVSIDESGNQTTQEGAPRAIVFGTAPVTGNVIYAFPARKIETEQGGKGGGPTSTSVQYLRTYAIRMCEGPIAAVIMAKQDGEIVYDARPGGALSAEDNQEFLKRCTIYLGGEDQLPDPDLEAVKGVGEVPAHRGTAYIVFADDDLSARSGSVPQYEFVVATNAATSDAGGMAVFISVDGSLLMAENSDNGYSRWQNTRNAVVQYLEGLKPLAAVNRVDICTVVWGGNPAAPLFRVTHTRRAVASSAIDFLINTLPNSPPNYGASMPASVVDAPEFFEGAGEGQTRVSLFITCGVPLVWNGVAWVPGDDANAQATAAGEVLLGIEGINAYAYNVDLPDTEQSRKMDNTSRDFVPVLDSADPDAMAAAFRQQVVGAPVDLSAIVAAIHARCGQTAQDYDVSELTDKVAGLVLASQGYTGADAIDTLRTPYFFDRSEWGGKVRYVKRGKPVVASLTIDDLVEAPDESTRADPVTYPRKLHLKYQSEATNWEVTQVTSERITPDVQVVGESSAEVPVVLTAEQAQTIVAKLQKVAWADAEGEVKFGVSSKWLQLVPGDCIGLTLRGKTRRLRIAQIDDADGVRDLTCYIDRQSAYQAAVTVIPVPAPSPTPGRYVGETQLAVLDIPALTDAQDVLGYSVAGTGSRPAWRGYQAQRSTDGGASFVEAATSSSAAVMGRLLAAVPAASPWYTDHTNTVRVQLTRTTQELASVSDAMFLQRGGAFALQSAGGEWEVLQYRDAVDEGDGVYSLRTLHRGQLASAATAHAVGAQFVLLASVIPVAASSAWLGLDLVHRGVGLGQSPDGVPTQSQVYMGRQQQEWPVASLAASRAGGVLFASWAARHRFGTDLAPVASANFQGFRVSVTGGGAPLSVDTTAETVELDVSALALPITVSVAALNRITGAGPAVNKVITA